jgi:glycosyltransferase involved in cell wall biosynthesis
MGTFNPTNVIYDAIHSILNQTFRDFEFIIYNDGSNDLTSKQILLDIPNLDERIILIDSKFNRGLAHGLNECINISKSNFLVRMDDDDVSELNRIEVLVDFANKHPEYSVIGSAATLFDIDGDWGELVCTSKPTINDCYSANAFIHPSTLLRKSLLKNVDFYREDNRAIRLEDYDLWLRIYLNDQVGINLSDRLYKIREDKLAYRKRGFKFRIDEFRLRLHYFKFLRFRYKNLIQLFKPLLLIFIPLSIYKLLRKVQYKNR